MAPPLSPVVMLGVTANLSLGELLEVMAHDTFAGRLPFDAACLVQCASCWRSTALPWLLPQRRRRRSSHE